MKKIYFLCIVGLCATSLQTTAQVDTFPRMSKHTIDASSYIRKSKNQKIAAWILFAGGLGLATTGLAIITTHAVQELGAGLSNIYFMGYFNSETTPATNTGPILIIAGTGAVLGSIPFFIISKKNARKAILGFSNEYAPQSLNGKILPHQVPSLRLTIPIR